MYISENHKKQGDFKMTDYAPGMRAVIRDEEWLIKCSSPRQKSG